MKCLRGKPLRMVLVACTVLALPPCTTDSRAENEITVYSFPGNGFGNPVQGVFNTSEGLYGVASAGSGRLYHLGGLIFAPTVQSVHTFAGAELHPNSSVISISSVLYGATANGAYSYTPGTSTFDNIPTDGDEINSSGMLVSNGTFIFGTSQNGGASGAGAGSIYIIDPATSLAGEWFDFGSLGLTSGEANPVGGLVAIGSTLYGTTEHSAGGGGGYLFKINMDGSGFQILHTFTGPDGANPVAALTTDGFHTLYGTTMNGGTANDGTVFKFDTFTSTFQSLHSFTGPDGAHPVGSYSGLFGTAFDGGTFGVGTVWAMYPDGTGFHVVHSFTGADGANPNSGFFNNILYATTLNGGAHNAGTIYAINLLPEPSSLALAGMAFLGLGFGRRALRGTRWR